MNNPAGIAPGAVALQRFYLPELDVLRFFAFLAVFASHAANQYHSLDLPDMGGFGVDLFFTLSAYLITELLTREKERSGSIDATAFYKRRILRIWPLYFAFLGIAFAIKRTLLPVLIIPWRYYPAFALFLGNFAILYTGVMPSLISPLWSVSVEEQFYLTWPLIMRDLTRRGIIVAALCLWAFSIFVRYIMTREGCSLGAISFGTFGRLDPIAAGILLSVILDRRVLRIRVATRLTLCVAGAALWWGAAAWYYPLNHGDPTSAGKVCAFALVAVGCLAFMLAAMGIRRAPAPLVYLGRISYGLYIFHLMVLDFGIVAVNGFAGWGWLRWSGYTCLELAVTVAIAAVSYRYFESPFLRLKRRYQVVLSQPN